LEGDPKGRPISMDEKNLSSLFGSLNRISASTINQARARQGAGGGGGSMQVEGNMDANKLIALNPYLGENVTSFSKGGQLTPSEYKKVQNLGRHGDTQLAHINPQEAAMLKAMGGSGTINPYTGLPEHFKILRAFRDAVMGGAKTVREVTDPIVEDIAEPFFDTAGELMDPIADVAHKGVSAVGDLTKNVMDTGVNALIKGVKTLGYDVLMPAFEAIVNPIDDILSDVLGHGGGSQQNPYVVDPMKVKRAPMKKTEEAPQPSGVKLKGADVLSNIKKSSDPAGLVEGDWVGEKENPYVTPNVEEELDYAAKGMKMPNYNKGGYFSQRANEAIALNQLSGLVSKANKGMKRRYTNGGRF